MATRTRPKTVTQGASDARTMMMAHLKRKRAIYFSLSGRDAWHLFTQFVSTMPARYNKRQRGLGRK